MQNFPTPPVREDTQVSVYILYTHFFFLSQSQTSQCPARPLWFHYGRAADWPESLCWKPEIGTSSCQVRIRLSESVQIWTEGPVRGKPQGALLQCINCSRSSNWDYSKAGAACWERSSRLYQPKWDLSRFLPKWNQSGDQHEQEVQAEWCWGRPSPTRGQEDVPWKTSSPNANLLCTNIQARPPSSATPPSTWSQGRVPGFPCLRVQENHTGSRAAYSRETSPKALPHKQ